ncbi:MAG: S8 family serine peptidase [Verrucomicrobia bacterium]|nr:S8 family serine peptidase [Verrucomicrobiota bacterium]
MIHRSLWGSLLVVLTCQAQSLTTFRLPQPTSFLPEFSGGRVARAQVPVAELNARLEDAPDEVWTFSDRVALRLRPEVSVDSVLAGRALTVDRSLGSGLFVLQGPDAVTAWTEAEALAQLPEVEAAYPIPSAPKGSSDQYAVAPRDELFRTRVTTPECEVAPGVIVPGQTVTGQWYLENRDPLTGAELGVDINIRPAWAHTRGAGVTVAVADTGIETAHQDLQPALSGAPHFNFATRTADGSPNRRESGGAHGTSAAGLIAATANNRIGMSGVAPEAKTAAWVIYDSNGRSVTTERIGDMFRYASNSVAVQNHSWGPTGSRQRGPDALEDAGLESAWTQGRNGLGTVMVFAAGNDRATGSYANDNGFASDPRVVGVTGVTATGRATAASEPGASILVAAPTGDDESGGIFTTDLAGTDGANFINFCPPFEYLSDFRWGLLGFKHTSAAAPLVSGIAALTLSVNPTLTARDVHQILLLSSQPRDLADPDLKTNGAGLRVSHNVGFGVVDAGEAVRLAQHWSNRPPAQRLQASFPGTLPLAIPEGGYRVEVTGDQIPSELAFISGIPGLGIQPDQPQEPRPLVHLGRATTVPTERLDGKGALIERGDILYDQKLANAAAAGASFAIVYNLETAEAGSCPGGDQLCVPVLTDFSAIPVIFIGRTPGLALLNLIQTNPSARVRLALNGAQVSVPVSASLQCERVGVRVKSDFSVRGDLRITLTSPSGTTSILQRYNGDTGRGPVDWTYWSTHHYFEPSAGTWTLTLTDQAPGEGTGNLLEATLILEGVPINDTDRDGLDDSWEQAWLATRSYGPTDDPDRDGYSVLRESLEGSHPLVDERSRTPDVGFFNDSLVRVSWPGQSGEPFQLRSGSRPGVWDTTTSVLGRFPVTATILPGPAATQGFFQVNGWED